MTSSSIPLSVLQDELDKAASLVETAQRLLKTGTMVDLTALEGKVRRICAQLTTMDRDDSRVLVPAVETLLADLDNLDKSIRQRVVQPFPLDPDPLSDNGDGQ